MNKPNETYEDDRPTDGRRSRRPWIIAGSVVGGILLILGILTPTVFLPASVTSQGVSAEGTLDTDFGIAVAQLHRCVVNTARAAQVAGAQTDAVDKVLKDAVAGRFGTGTAINQNAFFSAIVAAYPDKSVASLSATFQDALSTMLGCQSDFTGAQAVVQTDVGNFLKWQRGSWTARNFGGTSFPDQSLVLNVAGYPYSTGQAAWRIMSRPIVDTDTSNAIVSGQDNSFQNNPFATSSPSPTS